MHEVKQRPQGRLKRFGLALDDAILSIAPAWGQKRIAARQKTELQARYVNRVNSRFSAWEAADRDRIRGSRWMSSRLSPDSELEESLLDLWDHARDLYKNDPFASGAIKGRVDNVIGCGIRVQARVQSIDGRLTDEQAQEHNRTLEAKHKVWAKCERLYAKQRLFQRCKGIFGEAILVMSDQYQADKPVPLSIQVIDPRRLETPHEFAGDRNVRLGIRYDEKTRRPVTYYIRKTNPDDTKTVDMSYDAIPADRVCHSYVEELPEQSRGYPWLAPAFSDLKDAKDMKEASLIAEQTAACFAGFVTTDDPEGAATGAATVTNGERLEDIVPGTIGYLNSNQKIDFSNPNRPGNSLGPYMDWIMRGVASAIRYPFELLTKMFSNNFSGGRLSLIDGRITFRVWQQEDIEDCWERVWCRFVDECVMIGEVDIEPDLYLEFKPQFQNHAQLPPGFPWVDPVKDVKSDTDAIAGNLATEASSCAARGEDWEEVKQQRLREQLVDVANEAAIVKARVAAGLPEYPPEDVPPPAPVDESKPQEPGKKPASKPRKPAKAAA